MRNFCFRIRRTNSTVYAFCVIIIISLRVCRTTACNLINFYVFHSVRSGISHKVVNRTCEFQQICAMNWLSLMIFKCRKRGCVLDSISAPVYPVAFERSGTTYMKSASISSAQWRASLQTFANTVAVAKDRLSIHELLSIATSHQRDTSGTHSAIVQSCCFS